MKMEVGNKNWYDEVRKIIEKYKLGDNIKEKVNGSKNVWKKQVTKAVDENRLEEFENYKGSKARFLSDCKRKSYVTELNKNEVIEILKIRL